MASSSSSITSFQKSYRYDVFLSFRGEDTRKNFVDHLYAALQHQGIHTYKDDERLEKGKRINDELLKSIEDSKFCIIVFSKNYASSSWCLDELVKIMECHKTNEQTAYPVFYDVDPSEVRKQHGVVGKAIAVHGKKDVTKWKEALREAANLSGWDLRNTADGHEAKVIKIIVEQISLELRSIHMNDDESLIGMDARMKDLESSLEISLNDVRMIGIKGIGGGGKTTLAKALFDKISTLFEGISFVENVREVSKASRLHSLQKQILSNVFKNEGFFVSSVHEGKNMMKTRLRGKKVFIVLDDVDHISQLEALAGAPSWFKEGSRIIITTRDQQVLVAHKVEWIHDVNLLTGAEAICLFSRCAFGTSIPIKGYEKISHKVVDYAAGLPLTIKVLGSFLCGKDKLEWNDAVERLKTIPEKETLEKLELSYIGLEDDYKEIFLDVACLLKGWKKEKAIRMLQSCGFHARNGLRVLEQKSLITINKFKCLSMHDHIEEMGKNIVRRLHPGEPNLHSRLWIQEEIENILANNLGTEVTRCIDLKFSSATVMEGLGRMKKLECLIVDIYSYLDKINDNVQLDQVSLYFPDTLRFIQFDSYPHCSLPDIFRGNNLVALKINGSRIEQLWQGGEKKVLNNLKYLDLIYSNLKTLDLGLTPNLERLNLKGCEYLVELHTPIGCPKRLVYLNLDYCLRLNSFSFIKHLESLEILYLNEMRLREFPDIIPRQSNSSLLELKFESMDIKEVPSTIGNLHELVSLHFCSCYNLKSLPNRICSLHRLKNLNLRRCGIVELPVDLGRLECLETLNLLGTDIKHLPDSICMLKHLNTIILNSCIYFEKLPDNLGQLESLKTLCLENCRIKDVPVSICMLKHLETLHLISCKNLEKLPEDLGRLESLKNLSVRRSQISDVPASIGELKHLQELDLNECDRLEKLPEEIGNLEGLKELNILGTRIWRIPRRITLLKGLKILKFELKDHLGPRAVPRMAAHEAWIQKQYALACSRDESEEYLILYEPLTLKEPLDQKNNNHQIEYVLRYPANDSERHQLLNEAIHEESIEKFCCCFPWIWSLNNSS